MGANFPGQEASVEEVRALSDEARGWLSHHMRNSLCAISILNKVGETEKLKEAVEHMEADLNMFGL